jgi:acetyltransferase-like isoleucine patch superfamily enzyme
MKRFLGRLIGWIYKIYFKLRFGSRVQMGKGFICNWRFKISGKGRVFIGDNCNFWAHDRATQIYTYTNEALVKIGDNCRLNGAILMARERIEAGSFGMIGSANILDNDFHSLDYRERRKDINGGKSKDVDSKPVVIGDDVWISGEVIVLKGVEIGDRSVIGTRAVVTKSVEAESVAVGNPAKVVKSIKFET